MPLVEPPDGRSGRGGHLLAEETLEVLDGRRAYLQLRRILQSPGEPLSAKIRFGSNRVAEMVRGFWRPTLGLRLGGRPFGDTRQIQALPYPLHRPGAGRLRATALLDLRRTPGKMALAQGSNLVFGVEGKAVVGPLRTAWVILQSLVEGGKRPMAKLIQITATDPTLGGDLWERDPAEAV